MKSILIIALLALVFTGCSADDPTAPVDNYDMLEGYPPVTEIWVLQSVNGQSLPAVIEALGDGTAYTVKADTFFFAGDTLYARRSYQSKSRNSAPSIEFRLRHDGTTYLKTSTGFSLSYFQYAYDVPATVSGTVMNVLETSRNWRYTRVQ